jgi:TonB-linked SusC/RagA family outer membrane protein
MKYRDEKGNLKGDNGNKITARLGTNFSPLKNFKIGFISTIAYTKHTNGIPYVSDRWLPFMPLKDDTSPTGLWVTAANPLSRANHDYSDQNQTYLRSISNFTAEYSVPFIQGLSVKVVAGYDFITGKAVNWSSSLMNDATNTSPLSTANETQSNSTIAMGNIGLNYDRTFGDHNITAVVYQEGQQSKSWYSYMNAENLSTKFHEIGQSPGTLLEMNSGLSGDFRLLSTLGRAGYKFKSRYLLEASMRLDATSKFSPEKQNATFGSVGAGWIVSEESFFKNSISWMNLLKVRGSVGQTGNGDMPDFKYMNAYTIGKWFMNQQYSYIQNIGNPEITWETSNNSDVGIDFGLFKSKINGSIAYYKKNVNGLLLEVPLPMSAGIPGGNTVWQNIGDMSNSGVEITLNYTPVKTSDFSWDMSFNFSTNKNEILALHPAVDAKGWGIEGYQTITRTGGKLATFYLPEYAGIDPERGIPMIYERDADIYSTTGETVKTGKQIPFNSVTGAANRFIQDGKSSMPDWYGGFNNNFRYKSFDLNLMFSYAGNSYFINEAARSSRNVSFGWQRLADDILENSWKQPGDNAKYQELIYGGGYYYDSEGNKIDKPVEEYGMASTRELTSNDYLRLRFVTLGYNLPASLVNKIRLSGIRVYTSINNAFTISKAPAEIDPELGIPGNLEGNFVYYGLPPVRTFSFGVSINF